MGVPGFAAQAVAVLAAACGRTSPLATCPSGSFATAAGCVPWTNCSVGEVVLSPGSGPDRGRAANGKLVCLTPAPPDR
jgi:hypothetical protein